MKIKINIMFFFMLIINIKTIKPSDHLSNAFGAITLLGALGFCLTKIATRETRKDIAKRINQDTTLTDAERNKLLDGINKQI